MPVDDPFVITRTALAKYATQSDVWAKVYDDILPLLKVSKSILELELASFADQSGKDRIVLDGVRVKDKDSFVAKICRLGSDPKKSAEKFGDNGALSVFQLVNDLVGGRQVFYFERDIQEAVIFWTTFPVYQPVEITHWVQDLSGYDIDLPAAKWIKAMRRSHDQEAVPTPKPSGYESLHFILRFDPRILDARRIIGAEKQTGADKWKCLADDIDALNPRLKEGLADVHFEIQCRTILEHAWAEVEHRANYSIKKAGRRVEQREDPPRVFRNYKAVLRAAQTSQNYIRSGFSRWDEDSRAILGRSTNVHIGNRGAYWNPDALSALEEVDKTITSALEASHASSREVSEELWTLAWTSLREFALTHGGEELFKINKKLTVDEYGRRRLVVMLLGFILAYMTDPDPGKSNGSVDAGTTPANKMSPAREAAARTFLQQNVDPVAQSWIPTRVVVIRVYELLKLLDQHHAIDDPLIGSRAASVYFRHFGSFRRAAALLEEALAKAEVFATDKGIVLAPRYLGLRLAETYWAAYLLEGRRRNDLDAAMKAVRAALAADRSVSDANRGDISDAVEEKLLAHLLTMNLYLAVAEISEKLESGWEVLTKLRTLVAAELAHVEAKFPDYSWTPTDTRYLELVETSLRLQGDAIVDAVHASEPGARTDARLVSARRKIRKSRENIEAKVREGKGWALPFQVEVAIELEDFIFSLCSDGLHAAGPAPALAVP